MATRMQEADAQTPYPPIQYRALARLLFDDPQVLVPFLGAGASISEVDPPKPQPLSEPEQDTIDGVCSQLSLTGAAKDFLETAIRVARQMQQREADSAIAQESPFEAVKRGVWPPSAGELAAALADMASYDHFSRREESFGKRLPHPVDLATVFRWAANVTGLASSAPPLLSVASYCSYTQGSDVVWRQLKELFQNKTKTTKVHRMVACMAWHHVRRVSRDYLIVTTNYDRLVEQALKLAEVPYCVLAVDKTVVGWVDATLSEGLQAYFEMTDEDFSIFRQSIERPPLNSLFQAQPHRPIAVVYKIHGCLYPPRTDCDSIILTDEDYVDYIRKDGAGNSRIPAGVRLLMERKGFLFMGYSFSDWNVRSWYKNLVEDAPFRMKHPQDYAVLRDLDPYEGGFFEKRSINILFTDLNRFAESIMDNTPADEARACGAWQ